MLEELNSKSETIEDRVVSIDDKSTKMKELEI
jgi:hypothetical protein